MILHPSLLINYSLPTNFKETDLDLFHPSLFSDFIESIELSILKQVVITNSYIYHNNKVLFAYTNQSKPVFKYYFKDFIKKCLFPKKKIEEASIGINCWSFNYFHWMTEVLPSIIAIHKIRNNTTVILSCSSVSYPFILNSLNFFSIPYYIMNKNEVVSVAKLYAIKLPAIAKYNEPFLAEMKFEFIKKLNIDISIVPYKKIYISRRNANMRKVINEEALLKMLNKYDFEFVCLEDFNLENQIRLLSISKTVISSHGAGLTNILFMQPNQKVIELKADNNDYWCFYSLAQLAKLDYNYLLCKGEIENHRLANIEVDLKVLENLLNSDC